jgi:hypothetical protein
LEKNAKSYGVAIIEGKPFFINEVTTFLPGTKGFRDQCIDTRKKPSAS